MPKQLDFFHLVKSKGRLLSHSWIALSFQTNFFGVL